MAKNAACSFLQKCIAFTFSSSFIKTYISVLLISPSLFQMLSIYMHSLQCQLHMIVLHQLPVNGATYPFNVLALRGACDKSTSKIGGYLPSYKNKCLNKNLHGRIIRYFVTDSYIFIKRKKNIKQLLLILH